MVIRPLNKEELKEIGELWSAAGLPYKPAGRDNPDELAAYAEANPDLCLAAEVGGRLAGAVIGSDDGRKGWINRLAVHPDFQKRGIGLELIGALEKNLHARGRRVFGSLIVESNEPSIALSQKAGYSKLGNILYFRKAESEED